MEQLVKTGRLMFRRTFGVAMAFLLLTSPSLAEPVSADAAHRAIRRWVAKRSAAHLKARMNRAVRSVRTVRAEGRDVFHVVNLDGGGFVVAAADDRIEPVIAFAETGSLAETSENPLWTMLNLDVPRRLKAHLDGRVRPRLFRFGRTRGHGLWRRSPREEWSSLLGDAADSSPTAAGAGVSEMTDVRVDALVTSTWNQSTVGSKACYNTSTPNGYVCGCVATAAAQLMRYHAFPDRPVTPQTFSCWVDDLSVDKTMMGGTYDWDAMPLNPSASVTEPQRQAIGKLCYDVGVASRMNWTPDWSGACDGVLAQSLVDVFGYASAKCEMTKTLSDEKTKNAIYANLDAKCPVLLGICTTGGERHEIVADGYGIYNGAVYTHLNLGWSGAANAWYQLPSVAAGGYDFAVVNSVVYNVFPAEAGELVTGRILDDVGRPLAGVTVTATSGTDRRTATTDDKGIYAVRVPSSPQTWTITADAEGFAAGSTRVAVVASKSSSLGKIAPDSCSFTDNGIVGNRWGNDITLVCTEAIPTSVSINGPERLGEGRKATYVCAATFADGSVRPLSPTWSLHDDTTTTGFWFWKKTTTHASMTTPGVVTSQTAYKTVTLAAACALLRTNLTATCKIDVVGGSYRPANDDFVRAVSVDGPSGTTYGSNVNASDEGGEPLKAFEPTAVGTVWWTWTAPASGQVRFDTVGSAVDAVLGVYTGTSLAALTAVAENDNRADGDPVAEVDFDCTGGKTYWIAVAGYCGLQGDLTLNWRMETPIPSE